MGTTRCEYTVSYNDFLSSMKCYRKVSRQAAIGYLLYVWVLPAICFSVGTCILYSLSQSKQQSLTTQLVLVAVALGIGFGLPARYRVGLHRAFKQRNTLTRDRPMFFEFNDISVRFIVPEGAEVSYRWKSFTHFMENDQVAVLFIKNAAFHTIPKRALGQDDWKRVKRFVELNVRTSNAD